MLAALIIINVHQILAQQDLAYFDLRELETETPRPIYIYTNHPELEPILEQYATKRHSRRADRYIYLQSQKYTEVPLVVDEPNDPSYHSRPHFKTSPTTNSNIQKIPTTNRTSRQQTNINNILKRYITKLSAKTKTNRTDPADEKSKFFEQPLVALKNKTVNLAHKFLSLFTVVQFPNSKCQANGASMEYEGTCFHQSECDQLNGTAIGECANGYGVCCVFRYTCGGSSAQNCSYFESPGYPNYYPPGAGTLPPTQPPVVVVTPTPDPRVTLNVRDQFYHHNNLRRSSRQNDNNSGVLSCVFTINRLSNEVQQMRIDFLDLELRGPTGGECIDERLVISGQGLNGPLPVICGYNSGQHVYVDVSGLNGPLQIAVLSNVADRKRFQVRVCQISTGCATSANCLQYYTGVQGSVSSFNYDQSAIYSRSTPGYFNNLNYAICIRKEAGYCSVTYTNVQNGVEYPFELLNVDDNLQGTVPEGQAGAEVTNCPDDYVIISGVRLCGYKLNDGTVNADFTMNAPVTDTTAGPIVIPVRTDGIITGRGFKLFYTQNPCPIF